MVVVAMMMMELMVVAVTKADNTFPVFEEEFSIYTLAIVMLDPSSQSSLPSSLQGHDGRRNYRPTQNTPPYFQ